MKLSDVAPCSCAPCRGSKGAVRRKRGMSGALYNSFEDVRLEKARFDAQVQQTAASYASALGAPLDYTGAPVTDTIVVLLALETADAASDTAAQLKSDFIAFYASWNSFYATGTDQASTLWFPNFPDGAEWETLMQYEAALVVLQNRITALYPSASLVVLTPGGAAGISPGALFPSLSPAVNATLTSVVWVGAAGAIVYVFGPALMELFSGAAAVGVAARSRTATHERKR
jgi:hypothetical protein